MPCQSNRQTELLPSYWVKKVKRNKNYIVLCEVSVIVGHIQKGDWLGGGTQIKVEVPYCLDHVFHKVNEV